MSAWSSGTWCTQKGPREQRLSRPPLALSRRDLPYASVLASPGSTSLHPHGKPFSRMRPPSSLSHPQSSHAASRTAAACVACSCAAPATTPTPHSPVFVGKGVDASSVPIAVEVVPFIAIPAGKGVDASSSHIAVAPVPFVPAPTPQQKKIQNTPAQELANPRQSQPSLNTLACPHKTPASRQHQLISPLCCAGARATPRHHTRPHTLSSLTGTHTPPPAVPASPARRLVLCRGLLLRPLPRHPCRTHLSTSGQVKMPCPCFLPLSHSPS
jgi:hypothetical protein